MVLTEAALFVGHRQPEESVRPEQFEVTPGELQLVIGDFRVAAHLLLAELDQQIAQFPAGGP